MLLTFEYFKKAAEEVERIINLDNNADFRTELRSAAFDIDDNIKPEFYRHMNTLFLNVILNRTVELGAEAEEKAYRCRELIVELIQGR
jgi:hypothetical protein